MDALSIEAAEAAVACGYPEGAAAVLIVELRVPRNHSRIKSLLGGCSIETGAFAQRIAKDEEDRLSIKGGRKSAFSGGKTESRLPCSRWSRTEKTSW